MSTVALNMISLNEAPRIPAALDSARPLCDEMIVIDTGSSDNTPAIAAKHGATVYHFDWCDDYAAVRNYALDASSAEWILVLDADDVIDARNVAAIRALLEELDGRTDVDGVLMEYLYEWDGDRCTQRFPIQRLIRRASGLRWQEPVHECILFPDASRVIVRHDIEIIHRPGEKNRRDRTVQLRALRAAIARGEATPRTWFNYANELRNSGALGEAITAFKQYVAISDDSVPGGRYHALVSAATCHLALGQMYDAAKVASSAMLLDPSRAEAYSILGEIQFKRREYTAAIPLFSAAVASTPPAEGLVKLDLYTWLSHERLASCYIRLGDAERAHAHAAAALVDHPNPESIRRFTEP